MTFKELNLSQFILKALDEIGYESPSEIQKEAIPHILKQKDILGCAQTGSGKTAAFAIPIINGLLQEKKPGVRVLILAPTRELALQIDENFKLYSKYTSLKSLAIFGGVPQKKQVATLKNGVQVLIATPGRLIDLMNQKLVSLSKVEILVLDEADHMLDIGFIKDIKKILLSVPSKRQTLFFSATMPDTIRSFANSILTKPIFVETTPVSSPAEAISQELYFVNKKNKTAALVDLLKNKEKTLVFTTTKHGADRLVKSLNKNNITAAAIHGNKSQNARQRVLNEFKNNEISTLIATDIAARGIDIDDLPCVINFELPNVPETYVHRIGRTGRAGKKGLAISFCDELEVNLLKEIQKTIGISIPVKTI